MDNTLGVTMVQRREQLFNISGGLLLTEDLVLLTGDLLEELDPIDELHDKVDVLLIDIGLIILDNIGVVKFGKDTNFLLNGIKMIL